MVWATVLQTRENLEKQRATASLFAQQAFFWDVSGSGVRVDFRLSLCCRWSSTGSLQLLDFERLLGSRCVSPRVKPRTMNTNSALGEKGGEDVFDASSEDELLGEQNQGVHWSSAFTTP